MRSVRLSAIAWGAMLALALQALAAGDPGGELRKAAAAGDTAAVRRHLNAGAPVDAADDSRRTALLLAVAAGHTAVARTLIEAGADINRQAANKDTPWLLAGASGRAEILRTMLEKAKPDLTIRNRFGGNALIPACERAHVEAVEVMLKSGIDLDHINDLGWTCLLEIVVLGDGGPRHVRVAALVLKAGANPSIADRDGITPLAHARRRGFTAVARLIEAHGGR